MPKISIPDVQKTPIFPEKHAFVPLLYCVLKGILPHHFKVVGLKNLALLTGSRGHCSATHHTLLVGHHIFKPNENNMAILNIGIPPNTVNTGLLLDGKTDMLAQKFLELVETGINCLSMYLIMRM